MNTIIWLKRLIVTGEAGLFLKGDGTHFLIRNQQIDNIDYADDSILITVPHSVYGDYRSWRRQQMPGVNG